MRKTYIHWTYEVGIAGHNVGKKIAKQNGEEPCTEKAFNCLLWRQLDQLSAAKGDTTDVSPDVVCDD
jgi:hypothetical protein